jgi:Gas vesicle synthesis protein GvpL/GvpF
VRGRASVLKQDFERVKGADEWGVKVFEIAPVVRAVGRIRSGKEYLKAKAALLPKRSRPTRENGDLAEFEQALKGVAAETAAIGNVSSGQRGLRFQTSLLVKRANRARLESVLKKFAENWADARRIECTGPWPPYSFMSRTDAGQNR